MLSDGKKVFQYKRGHQRGHHQKRLERCLFLPFLDNMAVVLGVCDIAG